MAESTIHQIRRVATDRFRRYAKQARTLAIQGRTYVLAHQRLALGAVGGVLLALTLAIWAVFASLPDRDALRTLGDMSQATTLYDINDKPVFTIFKEYRVEVPLSKMSPQLRQAILAIEDQRFSAHNGIDVIRIAAAAWADLRSGRAAQGGSTITQQLARQVFLSREKTLWRKVREAALAMRIERMYSKDEILELYLNKVYFGEGLHGAEAAARGYFGKSASDLTLSEAALLAGLVTAPSVNAPTVSLARATARRGLVLRAMAEQGVISREVMQRAAGERVELRDTLRREEPIGQYFKEEVRQQLVKQFGWERLSEGGLRVYTTIDPVMQRAAEEMVQQNLEQIEARRRARRRNTQGPEENEPLQGALVAMDPTSGEIRAIVGGRDYATSRFNRATQARRQPGSAFKPFVYAAALEAGYSPASIVDRLDEPIQTLEGAWIPEDEHSTAVSMTIRTALRTSSNRAAVRMLEDVGIRRTVDYAKLLGVGSVPSVPSLALGSGEVTLLTMTSAYAAFAAEGRVPDSMMIRRVEDEDGAVLFQAKPASRQVLTPETAFLMSSMLADVINAGTAYRARQEGFTRQAAGKTGTTNDFVDAWFVGYTPKIVTGVWIGFDQPHTIIANGFAGDLAVPVWARFMKVATARDAPGWFSPPRGIVSANVCRVSGRLPSGACDQVMTEYFLRGTVPTEMCQVHGWLGGAGQLVAAAPGHVDSLPTAAAPELAPVTPAVAQHPPAPPAAAIVEPEPPKKKRGFWGRVFGRRDKDDEGDK